MRRSWIPRAGKSPGWKGLRSLALALAVISAASGCGPGSEDSRSGPEGRDRAGTDPAREAAEAEPSGHATVLDDLGRTVQVEPEARRVVSLLPSATELVLALGVENRLLARTRHDRDPRIQDLPDLGGGMNPNLESVGRLAPDLVIAWADAGDGRLVARLKDLGIRTYAAESESVEDVLRHTERLGHLLGVEARADSLKEALERGLQEVAATTADASPPSVFYVVWHDPPVTTGRGTYLDSLITVAGGRNVFGDVGSGWPQVSLEEAVRRNPDAVVAAGTHDGTEPEPDWLRDRSGWREMEAVRAGRVLVVDPDLFNRPGPRMVEAARALAAFLHPERLPQERSPR